MGVGLFLRCLPGPGVLPGRTCHVARQVPPASGQQLQTLMASPPWGAAGMGQRGPGTASEGRSKSAGLATGLAPNR